ncbi:hypothetical protein ALC56_09914, partial [Trachymyrmex septentrionalis]
VPKIIKLLPYVEIDRNALRISPNVQLVDPKFYKRGSVDILIRAEFFFEWLEPGRIELGNKRPILQNTQVDWVIARSFTNRFALTIGDSRVATALVCLIEHCDTLNKNLQQFWALDDYRCKAYLDASHMSLVDESEQESVRPVIYLSHHGVIKETTKVLSSTTKLHAVFDASSKINSGKSLNDVLRVGTTSQNSLFEIVICFRFYIERTRDGVTMRFIAHKWCFNCEEVMESMPMHLRETTSSLCIDQGSSIALDLRRCVGGRLQHSSWAFERKRLIILSEKSRFSRLLFMREHQRLLHEGQLQLLISIRERYWPVRGRDLARCVCRECVRCARARPRELSQMIGSLPRDKVCFSIAESKSYVALFVFFATKKRVIGNAHLTFEEFSTIFVQIEVCLNSRPLSLLSSDPTDLEPLISGHFLIGGPMVSIPECDLTDLRGRTSERIFPDTPPQSSDSFHLISPRRSPSLTNSTDSVEFLEEILSRPPRSYFRILESDTFESLITQFPRVTIASIPRNKPAIICQWCDKPGHLANNYWKKQNEQRNSENKTRIVCQILEVQVPTLRLKPLNELFDNYEGYQLETADMQAKFIYPKNNQENCEVYYSNADNIII